jgi:hypothetical protein
MIKGLSPFVNQPAVFTHIEENVIAMNVVMKCRCTASRTAGQSDEYKQKREIASPDKKHRDRNDYRVLVD